MYGKKTGGPGPCYSSPNDQWMANGTMLATAGAATLFIVFALLKLLKKKRQIDLQNKVVLITGASSGVGEACARVFFLAGAKVVLCARREVELQRVKDDLVKHKTKAPVTTHEPMVLPLDLADLKGLPGCIKQVIDKFGTIDILINNGGISYRGEILDTDVETDIRLMTVNYFGQVALTKAVLPYMLKSGYGHIVAVSSIQGKISIPFRSAYSASKHALQAFFDCLQSELADRNIQATVVSPGYIRTNLSVNALTGDGTQHGVMDATTASGMPPSQVANEIARAVTNTEQEIILAPFHHCLVVYIRSLCPSVYFYIMNKRAKKQRLTAKKTS